jgi:hypothetical protein
LPTVTDTLLPQLMPVMDMVITDMPLLQLMPPLLLMDIMDTLPLLLWDTLVMVMLPLLQPWLTIKNYVIGSYPSHNAVLVVPSKVNKNQFG